MATKLTVQLARLLRHSFPFGPTRTEGLKIIASLRHFIARKALGPSFCASQGYEIMLNAWQSTDAHNPDGAHSYRNLKSIASLHRVIPNYSAGLTFFPASGYNSLRTADLPTDTQLSGPAHVWCGSQHISLVPAIAKNALGPSFYGSHGYETLRNDWQGSST